MALTFAKRTLRCGALLAGLIPAVSTAPAIADATRDGVTFAKQQLEAYRAEPAFRAPGDPFDARACAKGKSMLSIPNSSANPFLKGIIDRMKRVGADLGLKVTEWENQGQPSQWVQGMDFAIRDKVDIVDLISGIDPKTIGPQVKAAGAAGIKVMTSHFYDPSQPQDPLVSSSLTIGFNEVGRVLADWAIAATAGEADVVLVESDEVPPTGPLVKGFADEFAAHCPACRIGKRINVGVTEWGTKIQPSVQAAVLADPAVNVVVPIYDSMSQFVTPALRLTGKTASVKVATFNGTPFVLDAVQKGSVAMDLGESLDWIAYATVDGHLRDACGLPSPAALNVPFHIFDRSNAAEAGTPATYDKGYGDAYVSGFRRLWGLDH